LKYGLPIEVGINADSLNIVDSIVEFSIKDKATPGCQVLCAKSNVVFYHKAFGYHTYDSIQEVQIDDIYDIASITKIAATTLALMKLYDKHEFDAEVRLSDIICDLDTTDKKDILIDDVLMHQAGLKAWIPFYRKTINNDSIYNILYSRYLNDTFSIKLHDSLYLITSYRDSIYKAILDTTLRDTNDYLYSDLGFYLLKEGIECISQESFDDYLSKTFYQPMGLNTLGFNSINYYPFEKIVPTENDTVFRKQIVKGYVHDPGAAMLGGIGGHAGLFSNANDLAKLMQMLLNNGRYGEMQYLENETIKKFTSCVDCDINRRALGFDKPELNPEKEGPVFKGISGKSFGHSGFTGTLVWADPEQEIVYVFLSNRTFPDATNFKLVKNNIRTEIMKAFYNAISD
jgi:beta-N-acetylhexosaminidase